MKSIDDMSFLGLASGGMAKKKKAGKTATKRKMWSLDPPDDLRRKMELAMEATGKDRTTLLIECVREDLAGVVDRILEERRKAAEAWQSEHGGGSKKIDTEK